MVSGRRSFFWLGEGDVSVESYYCLVTVRGIFFRFFFESGGRSACLVCREL